MAFGRRAVTSNRQETQLVVIKISYSHPARSTDEGVRQFLCIFAIRQRRNGTIRASSRSRTAE